MSTWPSISPSSKRGAVSRRNDPTDDLLAQARAMTIAVDLPVPARALAVGAHADDIEFGCGATIAKWSAAGADVTMCICTDGSKGTWDGDADLDALIAAREEEQRAAAAILGASDVVFLRYVDGELESGLEPRARVCRVIRETRPDVVLGHDPWQPYRIHPDHFHAGLLVTSGIVAARDPLFFPDQDVAPHRPSTLLCFEPGRFDHVENVDGYVDRKVEALLAHRSQWRSTMAIDDQPDDQRLAFAQKLLAEARAAGIRAGLRAAEAFARIDDL
jgi:LmbE family N-acetylglucosaminyl deacetylase